MRNTRFYNFFSADEGVPNPHLAVSRQRGTARASHRARARVRPAMLALDSLAICRARVQAGVVGTPGDMELFARMLLRGGVGAGGARVLSAAAVHDMLQPHPNTTCPSYVSLVPPSVQHALSGGKHLLIDQRGVLCYTH
jgi:CubicO group peptidase (beta-lactamase class C family)